ncbi:endonuclease/exonuclease/phosphatase family protein [bacterium]|nr:endonuclease/exonuclease/phosphatase family protein [Akkermansiaceae bacterium]MDB4262542.1 endonuclease/exonuclease/phosphatase family protein [bacterium]MDA8975717.1 endonuclease/exonuclease/phosphatase family protein [Akkermansiaceae bacterium]MDB4041408.1 endonuclease/exonuclease/phosphatase family protein [Akkermansiaceae bacterium]MDB4288660.1 endonuclease/exonuclease/phosphatase family protein [bacterium]
MVTRFLFLLLLPFSLIRAEEDAPLKMVSYNIRHGAGMDGKIDLARLAKIIAKEDPDLVALQEVDQNCKRSGGLDQAAELGKLLKMDHRFGKFMDLQGGEYGMAVLSRLPIQETTRHVLPVGAEPRCALEIVVQPKGWEKPLSFIGIHNDWTKEEIRVRQVSDLLAKLKKKGHSVVLAGDFNAQPGSDSLNLLVKEGWKTLRKKPAATFPSEKPSVEIDFFIAKDFPLFTYQDKIIDELIASDHRPITVEISISPSQNKQ